MDHFTLFYRRKVLFYSRLCNSPAGLSGAMLKDAILDGANLSGATYDDKQ
jgi:uncharacterized protein YjbI with pentapeptide repeats